MSSYFVAASDALDPGVMAQELAKPIESALPQKQALGGGLLLATAAMGQAASLVGGVLAARWPRSEIVGVSFEGVLAEGRTYRDEPAMVLLGWSEQDHGGAPIPLVMDVAEMDAERIAESVYDAAGRSELLAGDLVLLFPDAHGSPAFPEMLRRLGPMLAPGVIAGAAASGLDGHAACAFLGGEEQPGAMIGLFCPALSGDPEKSPPPRVCSAGATRAASPWLEITRCRARWIDRLDEEPALDWVRRQLGLAAGTSIEPHLDQLLARIRPAGAATATEGEESGGFHERYVVGLDERRGSFSWPGRFSRGDELALALPDAASGREALRSSVERLGPFPLLLQFVCRARDEKLHGDSDLESAWVAHCAEGRPVVGVVGPYQLVTDNASGSSGECRIQVHSTVLAALR